MGVLTITSSAYGSKAGGARPCFRTETGAVFLFPWAPRVTGLAGWAPNVTVIPRPGRKALTMVDGKALETLSLALTLARYDHQDPVEDQLAALKAIAKSGDRVTVVGMSPTEQGPWRFTALTVSGEMRQAGTNYITRATVTVELTEASDPSPKIGPVSGGSGGASDANRPEFYTTKKGDTLRSIAEKFYGDPAVWQAIAKANGLKSPKVKVGKKLKLPQVSKGSKITTGGKGGK